MADAKGVQAYYAAIRNRLSNYIKSDYLANSETLLLYADDLLGEFSQILRRSLILKHRLLMKK